MSSIRRTLNSCRCNVDDTPLSLLKRLRHSPSDDAWHRFVALYEPFLRRCFSWGSIVAGDADDLVQDVLTTVLQQMRQFQHNGRSGAFRCWLRTIVRHRIMAFQRTRGGRNNGATLLWDPTVFDSLSDADSELSRRWDQEHNEHVLRQLMALLQADFTATTWTAFRRQVVDGVSAAIVAQELGISVNAALIAKSRVLSRLRSEAAELLD